MQPSQWEIFENSDKKYLSIGITPDGGRPPYIPVPWERTASAFNMKIPSFYLEPCDLEDEELMIQLESAHIIGMYILVPLEDYSFISRFPHLWDVYICRGGGKIDLSFVHDLKEWKMFYIRDAVIPDISPLFPPKDPRKFDFHQVCLTNYRIGDDDESLDAYPTISELLVE